MPTSRKNVLWRQRLLSLSEAVAAPPEIDIRTTAKLDELKFCEHQPDRPQEWASGAMAARHDTQNGNVHPHPSRTPSARLGRGGRSRQSKVCAPCLWADASLDRLFTLCIRMPVSGNATGADECTSRQQRGQGPPANRAYPPCVGDSRGESSGCHYAGQASREPRVSRCHAVVWRYLGDRSCLRRLQWPMWLSAETAIRVSWRRGVSSDW